MDKPSVNRFKSSEEMLAFLREKTDDIDSVVIPVREGVASRGPQGQVLEQYNVGEYSSYVMVNRH